MMTNQADLPIGVFDSGMGGLTVLNALRQLLPNENYLYLGDTARLPYGTKSKQTVELYAKQASQLLVDRGIKLLVVACNTAASAALETLKRQFAPIPVIGVIEPGANSACLQLPVGPIAVLATESTVQSKAYSNYILKTKPKHEVIEWPCSLLVALAEEGWHQGELVEKIIHHMISPLTAKLAEHNHKAMLLGCTHFPVFKHALRQVTRNQYIIIDSAVAVADAVKNCLHDTQQQNPQKNIGTAQFLVTDLLERFQRVGRHFLAPSTNIEHLELVALDSPMPKAKDIGFLS